MKPPTKKDIIAGRWPGWMNLQTAAAYVDMGVSKFSKLWPVLAAEFGLEISQAAGRRFNRESLDKAMERYHQSAAAEQRQLQTA